VREAADLVTKSHLSQAALAVDAGVSKDSVGRVVNNKPVIRKIAVWIVEALERELGRNLDVKKYVISRRPRGRGY
jgi:predicted transcriptional regulator